jgi:SET domain-containing protein
VCSSDLEGRRRAAEGNVFIFRLNRREAIDGSVAWNLARHANHSCAPNAASRSVGGRIWLTALRPVARGEEITYDYGYSFRDDPSACACGAEGCVGVIVAERHRS